MLYAFYLTMTHEVAVVVICTFILAIFTSAVFSKVKITRGVFQASILSLLPFSVKLYVTGRLVSGMIMQIFVAFIMFNGAYLLARVLIRHGQDSLAALMDSDAQQRYILEQLKKSTEEAANTELAFRQAQIKPHFLYNTINTMVSFCYTDSEKAGDLLVNFSKYLRLIFDVDPKSMRIPLERELELIKAYAEIEKARFGSLINVEYDIAPELMRTEIPPFCIQPLVENAIKHGLCKKASGGSVRIAVDKREGAVIIRVSDTGIGMPPEKLDSVKNAESTNQGVGFFNIIRRVKGWRGAQIDIRSTEGEGTTVVIKIPGSIL